MYRKEDESNQFYVLNPSLNEVSFIGDTEDLILFLAEGYQLVSTPWCYKPVNKYFLSGDVKNYFPNYLFFDGPGRLINISAILKSKARNKFFELNGFYPEFLKFRYVYSIKNKIYKGTFRKDPVEGTGKHRYHIIKESSVKYRHLIADWGNPETKEFRRGDKPDLWNIGHRIRKNNRSWKDQTKRKHQWKEIRG